MIAAHHYQISARAIRRLYKEQPQDIIVQNLYRTLAPRELLGIDDNRLHEIGWAPLGSRLTIAKRALDIKNKCDQLSTTPRLQLESRSLCDSVANPALGSLCQDMEDVLDYDHCDDTPRAQASHFMRATSQQTYNAHEMAVAWIVSNVGSAASAMAARLAIRAEERTTLLSITAGIPSKYLGRALHALQDSFSQGHVIRKRSSVGNTGPIVRIEAYKGQNHDEHDKFDRAAVDTGRVYDTMSAFGNLLIDVSKELIWITVRMAHAGNDNPKTFASWNLFERQWLALSDNP